MIASLSELEICNQRRMIVVAAMSSKKNMI